MAGLFGTAMLLILKAMGLSNQAIYLVAIPTIFAYQGAYAWLARKSFKYPYIAPDEAGEPRITVDTQ